MRVTDIDATRMTIRVDVGDAQMHQLVDPEGVLPASLREVI